MSYEIVWANGVDKDLKNSFNENFFLRIVSKLEYIAKSKNPLLHTERIKNFPPNIRKIRIGNFRLFLYIEDKGEVLYCLAVKDRKEAYKTKSLNQVLTLARKVPK